MFSMANEERRAAALQGIDPAANTVKIDATTNTVKVAGTVPVSQTGTVTVAGTVVVSKMPDLPAPVVNVPVPVVNVPAPVVNVPAPVVNVPAPVVNVPAPVVNVPEQKAPIVNVPAPVVNVPAPVVNVSPPAVTVDMPKQMPVTVQNEIRVAGLAAGLSAMRYAVSQSGGRTGYGSTTGGVLLDDMPTANPNAVQTRDNPVPVVIALFVNPADSGVDANFQRISLGSTGAGEWTRLGWPERVQITGEPQIDINRGQGTNRSKCKLYAGNNARGFNGRRSKTTFQSEWSTIDDNIEGTIICRPGMSVCWLFELSFGSGQRASVEVVWWETVAAGDPIIQI